MARIIALVGGGTMGPTAPLLALQQVLKRRHPNDRFVWAGTAEGPEKDPIQAAGMPFFIIPDAKIPRYFSLKLFTLPFDYLRARKAARQFLDLYKPNIVIGAGGYTQVPVIRAASHKGIPCLIHQLDFVPGWSNLAVYKQCKFVTTTFVYHYNKFRKHKNEKRIATPNRFWGMDIPERTPAVQYFGLSDDKPVLMVIGGGTGSRALNSVIEQNIDAWLERVQIIHLTGKGRSSEISERAGYRRFQFLDKHELLNAYAAADMVISRAGMGAITDLAALSKPTILVPIPNSHQEKNSRHLPVATIEVKESSNLYKDLLREVVKLAKDKDKRKILGYELQKAVPTDDGTEWADIVERYMPEDLE